MHRLLTPTADEATHKNPTQSASSTWIADTTKTSTLTSPLGTLIKTPGKTTINHTPRLREFLNQHDTGIIQQSFVHDHHTTAADSTRLKLRSMQQCFGKGVPLGGDDKCTGMDRHVVLEIYSEALQTLAKLPEKYTQIAAECTRKVRVVLGIIPADPDDTVFTTSGQLLKPLEPQYAEPRLGVFEDRYGHLAQSRLNAWRKEGWPETYPQTAVKNEKKKVHWLVDEDGNLCMSVDKMFRRVMGDDEMWDDSGMGYSGDL